MTSPLIVPSGEAAVGGGFMSVPATDPALAALRADEGAIVAAGGGAGDLFRRDDRAGTPRPISRPLLVLWTVVVPLAIAALAALAFLRLRPRALTIRPVS
jgi:hypothetical protein